MKRTPKSGSRRPKAGSKSKLPRRSLDKPKRRPTVLNQAEMLIDLAKEKGVKHLKVGEFEVVLPGDDGDVDTHLIGFEIDGSPSADLDAEDEPEET